jgi:hypothetical protein
MIQFKTKKTLPKYKFAIINKEGDIIAMNKNISSAINIKIKEAKHLKLRAMHCILAVTQDGDVWHMIFRETHTGFSILSRTCPIKIIKSKINQCKSCERHFFSIEENKIFMYYIT